MNVFKKNLMLLMFLGLVFLLLGCGNGSTGRSSSSFDFNDFEFPNRELPAVLIYIEDYGPIIAELYPEYAPITVNHFIHLVENKFYDGLTFHRIMSGFMMQGGCPDGVGFGGGENIIGEFADNGIDNLISHKRGVLSMARSTEFNSASSQFFIMHANSQQLDGKYAAFGQVIYGMDVVDSVVESATPIDDNGTIAEGEQPVIREIRLVNGSQNQSN